MLFGRQNGHFYILIWIAFLGFLGSLRVVNIAAQLQASWFSIDPGAVERTKYVEMAVAEPAIHRNLFQSFHGNEPRAGVEMDA